jgi:hypothetical protein
VREGDVPTGGELGRGVFCQIVADSTQSVGIVLARLRKRDDLRDDDFRYRVAHIALTLKRIALYEKLCGASSQYAPGPRRIPGWVGWRPETVDSEMGHEPLSTIVPLASLT